MLNEFQKPAVEWLVKNILESREPFMTLIGQGGSGKTYSIFEAVKQFQAAGLKVLLTAPTNKAVRQLEKEARRYQINLDNVSFMTTHGALGLAVLPSEDRKNSVRVGKGFIEVFDVVVVDEASMLSRVALFKHLVPDCQEFNTYLIGMGDDFQLPPVKEPKSAIFTEFPCWRLEGNERQKPGPLLKLNLELRAAMLSDKPFKAPEPDGNQVLAIPDAKFLSVITDAFDIDTELDDQRVIAWSNTRVHQINTAIRKKIYGENVAPYVVGERVVTGSPVRDAENQVRLGTDEECIVHHVNLDSSVYDNDSGSEYRTIRLVLNPIFVSGQEIVEVLHPDEQRRYNTQLEDMREAARAAEPRNARGLWAAFWRFEELFADIRYCYCITVHRSQGSSYDTLFFDVKDALKNTNRSERRSLIYVGYSRPRHQLIINKRKYVA